MKKILFLLVLALVLAACGGEDPTPTPVPPTEAPPTEVPATEVPATEVPPTEVPTEAPLTSLLDSMTHVPDPDLIDKTWAWAGRDPNGNDIEPIVITTPENYTLLFNEDGSFNAKADCNVVLGSYATDAPGSIFMEAGPSTMAFCGETSSDMAMLQMFGPAQDYVISEDGQTLTFNWVAGGPIDTYRSVAEVELTPPAEGAASGTVTAPDGIFLRTGPGTDYPYVGAAPLGATGEIIGVSQDGQWWLVKTPNLPEGQVWVSATFVEATNTEAVPVVTAPTVEPALTDVPWMWVAFTDAVAGETLVESPERYVVKFNTDGTANIQADCNVVLASYTTDGSSISILPGPSTLMACPEDSQADRFVLNLTNAAIYFMQGGSLFMDLFADGGTMRFLPQGSTPPTAEAPAAEADNSTFYLASFGPVDAPQAIIEGTQITASFSGTQVSGNAGCNNYSGTLTPVNDYFVVTDIFTTFMMCEEDVMAQEQAYLAGLQALTGYLWEQSLVNDTTVVTQGALFYALPDGAAGVMNFVTTP